MIVLNTVAKYYPQLDRPVKTGRSGSNRPKSKTSQKSEGNKSARSEGKSEGGTSEAPRQILNPQVVQNFIYTYILEKLKCEKLAIPVDARYEKFLNSLGNPLQINEMRTMKELNYENLRKLLANFLGSPVLRLIKDNQEALDMDPEVFDLVYEGFWDLYTFHPQIRDVSARKLQAWIQKIRLTAGPDRTKKAEEEGEAEGEAAADEEEKEEAEAKPKKAAVEVEGEDVIDPIAAVVRLKIPKVPKEPELDEDGNEIPVEVDESELEDIPFEDRCLSMVTKLEDQQIWVINHLAQKTLRQDLSAEFRASNDRLDNLDTQDFNFRLEKEAQAFEDALLKLLADTPENAETKAPKVPVFDFRPKY